MNLTARIATFLTDRVHSPIGDIIIVSDGEHIRALDFEDHESRMHSLLKRHYGEVRLRPARNPAGARECIERYLAGELEVIEQAPVATNGTPFQRSVWQQLRAIPQGSTWSYGELAARVGKPGAARAVGLANGSNPIAIVVPCHRVIGANGDLTGYGGGMERKRWLLQHEGALLP